MPLCFKEVRTQVLQLYENHGVPETWILSKFVLEDPPI